MRVRPILDRWALSEPRLAPPEDPSLPRHGSLQARREAAHVLPHGSRALTPLGRAGRGRVCGSKGMSRPKKMLPVLGQAAQEPEVKEPEAARNEAEGCTDDCSSSPETVEMSAATPRT